jgi:hypothetical protein
VTSSDRSSQEINRLGKLAFEFAKSTGAAEGGIEEWNSSCERCKDQCQQKGSGPHVSHIQREQPHAHAEQQELSGPHFDLCLRQTLLKGRYPVRSGKQPVEGGDLADQFISQQSQFFAWAPLSNRVDDAQALSNQLGVCVFGLKEARGCKHGDDNEKKNGKDD